MERRTILIASAAIIGLMLGISLWAFTHLPADVLVPIHWGDGAPDRFAGKEGLLLVPLIATGATAVLGLAPKSSGRPQHWQEQLYGIAWLAIVIGLAGFHTASVFSLATA